ncbi:MAG TPA: hypothetical protein VNI83_10625 [Vicinamibacterales bacterium]|nr:hypothetical protein [Vicinamibacterales bacterium]
MIRFVPLALLAALVGACGEPIDLARSIEVVDVSTGWFDAGVVEGGQNKLVPSITFRLRNRGGRPLGTLQLDTHFVRAPEQPGGEREIWETVYTPGVARDGLEPGATTRPLTVRGKVGYTSQAPRREMLEHRLFRDFWARIFVKHGSSQWVQVGEFLIERQLLTS